MNIKWIDAKKKRQHGDKNKKVKFVRDQQNLILSEKCCFHPYRCLHTIMKSL